LDFINNSLLKYWSAIISLWVPPTLKQTKEQWWKRYLFQNITTSDFK